MIDFKIRRGLSSQLFDEYGDVNQKLIIEEGCWYLCTDTAELFLGISSKGNLTLKRINGGSNTVNRPTISPDGGEDVEQDGVSNELAELKSTVDTILDELGTLKETKLFQEIADEGGLPTDFNAVDFNPNITYYIQLDDKHVCTYIFSEASQCYLCTTSTTTNDIISVSDIELGVDGELIVHYSNGESKTLGQVTVENTFVSSITIGGAEYTAVDGVIELPDFATKEYVEDRLATIENPGLNITILYGGDATPEDDAV